MTWGSWIIFALIMAIASARLGDFEITAICLTCVGVLGTIQIDDYERRQTMKRFGRKP